MTMELLNKDSFIFLPQPQYEATIPDYSSNRPQDKENSKSWYIHFCQCTTLESNTQGVEILHYITRQIFFFIEET